MITSTLSKANQQNSQACIRHSPTRWPLKQISQSDALPKCLDDDLRRAEDLALGALESNLNGAAFEKVANQIRSSAPLLRIPGLVDEATLPPTRHAPQVDQVECREILLAVLGVIRILNARSFAYASEQTSVFRAVTPVASTRNAHTSQGSSIHLLPHTDGSNRPMIEQVHTASPAPRWLVFGVVRTAGVPFRYMPCTRLLDQLPPRLQEVAQQPIFKIYSGDSFKLQFKTENLPLFVTDKNGQLRTRIALGKMETSSDEGQELLLLMQDILINTPHIWEEVYPEPGEVMILDNQRSLHDRVPFAPKWTAEDRFLIRVYATDRIADGVSDDPDRPHLWA